MKINLSIVLNVSKFRHCRLSTVKGKERNSVPIIADQVE